MDQKEKDTSKKSRVVINEDEEWDNNFSAVLYNVGDGNSIALTVPKKIANEWGMKKGGKLRLKIINYVKPEEGKKNGKRKK